MIQEKDFLYRVPVKNALVTAPGKQVRNPEILVDLEGGEFMHGDILDANSTNKLIDQSVKDAIDNSIEMVIMLQRIYLKLKQVLVQRVMKT